MAWKTAERMPDEPPVADDAPPVELLGSVLGLAGWLALTFCAPLAAISAPPGDWYASLNKPSWHPPSWVFGPVWTALYLLMAVAAWLVWRRGGWRIRNRPLTAYLVQLALNAAWSPAFFGLQSPGLALVVILGLLTAIVVTLKVFHSVSRTAALLLIPYLLWVNFATVLNLTLWFMNR